MSIPFSFAFLGPLSSWTAKAEIIFEDLSHVFQKHFSHLHRGMFLCHLEQRSVLHYQQCTLLRNIFSHTRLCILTHFLCCKNRLWLSLLSPYSPKQLCHCKTGNGLGSFRWRSLCATQSSSAVQRAGGEVAPAAHRRCTEPLNRLHHWGWTPALNPKMLSIRVWCCHKQDTFAVSLTSFLPHLAQAVSENNTAWEGESLTPTHTWLNPKPSKLAAAVSVLIFSITQTVWCIYGSWL